VVKVLDVGPLELVDTLLLNVNLDSVTRIAVQAGDEVFALKQADKVWKVVEGPGAPYTADERALTRLRGLLFNLRAERFAAYGSNLDLKKHGLTNPVATLTLSVNQDGKMREHIIILGGEVEGKSGRRYARVDQGPGIAVLDPEDAAVLSRNHLEYVDHIVLKLAPDKVTALVRQKEKETLEIMRQEDEWKLLKPQALRADDRTITDLLRQLAELRATAVAEYPLKDAKKYQLDNPDAVLTVRVTGPDGKPGQYKLALGTETPAKNGERYARVEGSQTVFVLGASVVKALDAKVLSFRSRALARFSDADRILLERVPRQATFSRVSGNWMMTAPLETKVDNDQLEEFLGKAARLEADELIVDRPADLKQYGLDKPTARWRFQYDNKDVLDLLIGKLDSTGKRAHARLGKDGIVFLLSPDMTTRALGEFRDRTVWSTPLDSAQADTLRLTRSGKTLTLKKEASVWKAVEKPEAMLNTETVNDTLAALAGLKLERYAMDKGADKKLFGLDPPELVIEAEAGEKKATLLIGRFEADSKRAYAAVQEKDRSDVLVLSEADTARLTRDLEALGKTLPKK
jgi:hypothetical protein